MNSEQLPAKASEPRRGGGAVTLPASMPDVPEPSPALLAAFEILLHPTMTSSDSEGRTWESLREFPAQPARLRAEAEDLRAAIGEVRGSGEITRAHLLVWLAPIATVVRNPPQPEALTTFAVALELVLEDLPLRVLSLGSQIAAMRTWRFFPSAAEVYEFLAPPVKQWVEWDYAAMLLLSRAQWIED